VIVLSAFTAIALKANVAEAQLMSTCAENSPERRGELGCTIIASAALPDGLKEPLFWHIDRFASLERARAAAGAASVAFDTGGTSWLMTIESRTADHHGGEHVAQVGPLPLPRATQYRLQVQSSAFTPGMYSLAHHHSGVEAVYVLEGEACFETPDRAVKLRKGESLAIPGDVPMRTVVTGSTLRRLLSIIVHDATLPATTGMEEGSGPRLVVCK
jgi:quercetin dioxygenase-like cupin family protein